MNMHDTLSPLIERALAGNHRPLEFYLRDQSRLPGPRANLELMSDVGYILAAAVIRVPEKVRVLLDYLLDDRRVKITGNSPSEFVLLCGISAYGTCAARETSWRDDAFELLNEYACSSHWRVREVVAMAYQSLLNSSPQETIAHLIELAANGDYLQQRAAVAAIAEPSVLFASEMLLAALTVQRIALERLRSVPIGERKNEEFRILRRALEYTLSVITAAAPDQGFALMRECATWDDADIRRVLRENLKKKRLAKFADTKVVFELLA